MNLIKVLFIVVFLLCLDSNTCLYAQQKDQRTVQISKMWNLFENLDGGGWETTWCWPGGRIREKLPGEFRIMNGCERKFGPSIGVQNWTNRKGELFPYYIASPGANSLTRNCGDASGLPGSIKIILRRLPPTIMVNGSGNQQQQTYDEIDPAIPCDVIVVSQYNYAIGLTLNRRIYYYAPQNDKSNSYIYYDYWFANTGKVRPEPDSIAFPGQTLHQVGITFSSWPMVAFEGATEYGRIWESGNDDWVDYYGVNYTGYIGGGTPVHPEGNPMSDSLRLWIDWDGTPPPPSIDDIGDPDKNFGFVQQSPGHGKLLSYQYAGFGILWADKNVTNDTNDLTQPFTTTWTPGGKGPSPFLFDAWYKFLFSGYHRPGPIEMGYTDPTDPGTVAAPFPFASVGLYDIPFGDSVHVVVAVAVDGINENDAAKYGYLWWQHNITDQQKDSIVATGRDLLLSTYSLATKRFFANIQAGRSPYAAPASPPSPDLYITSGKQTVELKWSDISQIPNIETGVDDFAGYRVYRKVLVVDTVLSDSTWEMLWDSKKAGTPNATEYVDSNVVDGVEYQYAVTCYNNGTQNFRDPGVSLESSVYWNVANITVGSATNVKNDEPLIKKEFALHQNYPNPFNPATNIKYDLPTYSTVSLEIFNILGQKVRTLIDHQFMNPGSYTMQWNGKDDEGNQVASGEYIYKIQTDHFTDSKKMLLLK